MVLLAYRLARHREEGPANREKPVIVPCIEHVPPDVTAGIFWLKNRDPQHWRDSQQLEHGLG